MFFNAIKVLIVIYYLIINVNSYSQVKISGKNSSILTEEQNNGPIIHKSINMDLLFPTIFNLSESTTNKLFDESISSESTGRAVYPSKQLFPQIISNVRKPSSSFSPYSKLRDSNPSSTNYVYPVYRPQPQPSLAEINKLRGKGQAMDRYTPGEAVATALFKKSKTYSYNNNGNLRPAASSQVISKPAYVPVNQKDLYSFPPNHSKYPPPNQVSSTNQVSSYIPPAAGPAESTVSDYIGPVNPEYLPPNLKNKMPENDDAKMQNSDMDSDMNSAMDSGKNNEQDSVLDDMTYPTPPPGYLDESPASNSNTDDMMSMPPMSSDHDHPADYTHDHSPDYDHSPPDDSHNHKPDTSHDHSHDHSPDYQHDHDHFHHDHSPHHYSSPWKSFPSFYGSHGIDDYPEVIYDDHHHHHHHHTTLAPLPPPPTTTEEPPPEPRVKKYSYFYLGRKLWYIPLYFTVWFSFYVLWLIIKSIARHKVNLPNHYQARSLMKRSILIPSLTHKEATEEIDQLTISVMEKIDNFKNKYLSSNC